MAPRRRDEPPARHDPGHWPNHASAISAAVPDASLFRFAGARVSTAASFATIRREETLKPGQAGSAPSLAVLPFTNRSHLPEDEVFAEGMVEDVISALSQGVNVRVLGSMATVISNSRRSRSLSRILEHGLIKRVYRSDEFPAIASWISQPVPHDSIASDHRLQPQELSESEECEPEVWFEGGNAARVDVVTEQLLGQRDGYAMLLLHVELADD